MKPQDSQSTDLPAAPHPDWQGPDGVREPIEGRGAFVQAIKDLLGEAAAGTWTDLYFCAPQFEDWPLGDSDVVDALVRWSRLGGARHCQFIAGHYEQWPAHHPRWVQWRRTWSHLVNCWQPEEEMADHLPSMLLLSGPRRSLLLELTNNHYQTGWLTRTGSRLGAARQEIDAILQRSVPGFSATVLGL